MQLDQAAYYFWDPKTTCKELLSYVLSVAKGFSVYEYTYEWDDGFTIDEATTLCRHLRLPYTGVLKDDVERAQTGQPPIYFMDHFKWVDLYRMRHSIQYVPPEGGFVYGSDTLRDTEEFMDRIESGFINAPRELGWACPK